MEIESNINVQTLLNEFNSKKILESKKLNFEGIGIKDAYNITAPFTNSGETYIAARVESRNSELDSKVLFFILKREKWILDNNAPIFDLQDPSIIVIGKRLVLCGVKVFFNMGRNELNYKTIFFEGNTVYDLKEISEGPQGMKDIRIIELSNGRIGVFTRPQGLNGGRGRIGFIEVGSFENFKAMRDEAYYNAPLIINNIAETEWVGANALYQLSNGLIGVLGHIACFSNLTEKNYYPIVFAFHPDQNKVLPMKIIARRKDLPNGQAKRNDLKNVIFSGGLIRKSDNTAILYTGVGDAEAYQIMIEDPFLSYENLVV